MGACTELPDLRLPANVRVLDAWDGDLNKLQRLGYAHFKRSMLPADFVVPADEEMAAADDDNADADDDDDDDEAEAE